MAAVRRIRAQFDSRKLWLTYSCADGTTVRNLKVDFAKQLGLDVSTSIQLELDGFALLDGSSASILDGAVDILQITTDVASATPFNISKGTKPPAKRRKLTQAVVPVKQQQQQALPSELKNGSAFIKGKGRLEPAKTITRPSQLLVGMDFLDDEPTLEELLGWASDATSDTSTSSSRSSSSSSSSSSASSSSDSPAESSSASSTSSSSSSSSSTSSSSGSSAPPAETSSKLPANTLLSAGSRSLPSASPPTSKGDVRTVPSVSTQEPVPPGQGKATTRNRNARKRKRAAKLKEAKKNMGAELSKQADEPAVSGVVKGQQSSGHGISGSPMRGVLEDGEEDEISRLIREKEQELTASSKRAQETASVQQAETTRAAPESTQDPDTLSLLNSSMMSNVSGQSTKKRKAVKRSQAEASNQSGASNVAQSGRRKWPEKGHDSTMDANQTLGNGTYSGDLGAASPAVASPPPRTSTPFASMPRSTTDGAVSSVNLDPHNSPASTSRSLQPPPPPSTRSDLPSNMIVTSLDVEANDFQPGVAQPDFVAPLQTPWLGKRKGIAKHGSEKDAEESFVIGGSTQDGQQANARASRNARRMAEKGMVAKGGKARNGSAKDSSDVDELERIGWAGWPSDLDAVEEGLESMSKINAPGDGEKVVVKVLELSPASYLPDLSVYYGVVLALTSDPHGESSIKLRLHPSCRPSTLVSQDETDYGNQGEEEASRIPKYFGEDLTFDEDGDSEAKVEDKVIRLDDIVECRRIRLSR